MLKKIFLGMLLICSFVACKNSPAVTEETRTVSNERTTQLFASVNEKIYGDVHTLLDGNFKNFKMKDYYQHLKQYRSPKAEELKSDLKDFEVQNLYAYSKTFVICIHSAKRNYTICDDARCPRAEKYESGSISLVQEWITEFPMKICPLMPKINY